MAGRLPVFEVGLIDFAFFVSTTDALEKREEKRLKRFLIYITALLAGMGFLIVSNHGEVSTINNNKNFKKKFPVFIEKVRINRCLLKENCTK